MNIYCSLHILPIWYNETWSENIELYKQKCQRQWDQHGRLRIQNICTHVSIQGRQHTYLYKHSCLPLINLFN